jgi:hypothetical protein
MTERPTRVKFPSHVHATLVDDGYIVVDLRTGRYFALDEVGSVIWSVLTEGNSVDDAVERVTRVYRVEREQALADVSAFLHRLSVAGLIDFQ